MIGQFPTPYPDELLYSLIARYKQRVKYPSNRKLFKELFGSETSTVIHDLPCNLEFFSKTLPLNNLYSVNYILDNLTLLPYYSAFSSNEIMVKTKRQMAKANGSGIHARLGLMATKVSMPQYMRYCPSCISEEVKNYGETYWHRSHQLPGVLICLKHQIKLVNSHLKITSNKNPNIFTDANEIELNTTPLFDCANKNSVIYKIAEQSIFLLERNYKPQDKINLKNKYNYLLVKKGLSNYGGSLHIQEIISEFLNYYSENVLTLFGCELNQNYSLEDSWIVRLLRKPYTFCHPVYHLLSINFLGEKVQDFWDTPTDLNLFGKSPWVCLNPAAGHYKKKIITNLKFGNRIRKGKPIGIFKCECGFEYARSGPDNNKVDKLRIDKIINFGSVWESELIRLWNESHKTITEISRCLNVDPLTIRRYATKLQLSFNRIGKKYIKLAENDELKTIPRVFKQKSKSNKIKQNKISKKAGYIDWETRDNEISILVRKTAERIRGSTERPRAVTKTAIGREANCLALLLTKLHKLPKTAETLNSIVDTDLTFANRKIDWVVKNFQQKGIQLKKWKIIEAACVYRFKNIPAINDVIESAMQYPENSLKQKSFA